MRRLPRLLKDYTDTGALNELVNLYGFVDDRVFLTKSGDVGVVLRVRGVDDECLDHGQRARVAERFVAAIAGLDERMRLSQYFVKSLHAPVTHGPCADPRVDAIVQRRAAFLNHRPAPLFSCDLYFVLLLEHEGGQGSWPARARQMVAHPREALLAPWSTRRTMRRLARALDAQVATLLAKADAFCLQLQDTLEPVVLPKAEAFQYFRRLLNVDPAKADAAGLHDDRFLDFYACDSALECHRDHLRLDDHLVRVLTLKAPPSRTCAHVLRLLEDLPSAGYVVTDWRREAPGPVRRAIQAKRRHFHNSKASLLNYVSTTPTPARTS